MADRAAAIAKDPREERRQGMTGMFGVTGTGDTSGFGGLTPQPLEEIDSPRPYGGYFDEVMDALAAAYPGFDEAVERVVVDRGELTIYVKRERIAESASVMRDDPSLRFELCSSLIWCGLPQGRVQWGQASRRAPAACGVSADLDDLPASEFALRSPLQRDPHLPSVTSVYQRRTGRNVRRTTCSGCSSMDIRT